MTETEPIYTATELEKLVSQLAQARAAEGLAKIDRDEAAAALRLLPQYIEFDTWVILTKNATAIVEALEQQVRDQALLTHELNPENKHPHEALEVVKNDTAEIVDKLAAKEWCMFNYTAALTLDEKKFCKEAIDGNIPTDLAIVKHGFKVRIDSDLSKFA
jgi:hypothetical protein